MENIKFYKLLSPYSEDETKNCKLSITDIDSNFLAFKDNDIRGAEFDETTKSLNIIRNNGETINVDLSSLQGSGTTHGGFSPNYDDWCGIHTPVSEACLTGNAECFMYEPVEEGDATPEEPEKEIVKFNVVLSTSGYSEEAGDTFVVALNGNPIDAESRIESGAQLTISATTVEEREVDVYTEDGENEHVLIDDVCTITITADTTIFANFYGDEEIVPEEPEEIEKYQIDFDIVGQEEDDYFFVIHDEENETIDIQSGDELESGSTVAIIVMPSQNREVQIKANDVILEIDENGATGFVLEEDTILTITFREMVLPKYTVFLNVNGYDEAKGDEYTVTINDEEIHSLEEGSEYTLNSLIHVEANTSDDRICTIKVNGVTHNSVDFALTEDTNIVIDFSNAPQNYQYAGGGEEEEEDTFTVETEYENPTYGENIQILLDGEEVEPNHEFHSGDSIILQITTERNAKVLVNSNVVTLNNNQCTITIENNITIKVVFFDNEAEGETEYDYDDCAANSWYGNSGFPYYTMLSLEAEGDLEDFIEIEEEETTAEEEEHEYGDHTEDEPKCARCKYYEGDETSGRCTCIYCLLKQATGFNVGSGGTVSPLELSGDLSDEGVLTLNWKYESDSGETKSLSISGFVESAEIDLTHDNTLTGNGGTHAPLRLSNNEKTSFYKPVLGIVDELPETEELVNGARYITKESVDNYGYLYSANALRKIKFALQAEQSMWRIPTKEDWDKMLNHIEICSPDRNHNTEGDEIALGRYAALLLKSTCGWSDEDIQDNYKFNALPVKVLKPLRFNEDYDEVSSAVTTTFWSDTSGYTKSLKDESHEVFQEIALDDTFASVRLMCDYDDLRTGFNTEVLGDTYGIVHFPKIHQIWIDRNLLYDLNSEKDCKTPEGDCKVIEEHYYINHWNGENWEKKRLEVGDKFTVLEGTTLQDWYVAQGNDNKDTLVKTLTVSVNESGDTEISLDCGWY